MICPVSGSHRVVRRLTRAPRDLMTANFLSEQGRHELTREFLRRESRQDWRSVAVLFRTVETVVDAVSYPIGSGHVIP